jgi:hypothetical protein
MVRAPNATQRRVKHTSCSRGILPSLPATGRHRLAIWLTLFHPRWFDPNRERAWAPKLVRSYMALIALAVGCDGAAPSLRAGRGIQGIVGQRRPGVPSRWLGFAEGLENACSGVDVLTFGFARGYARAGSAGAAARSRLRDNATIFRPPVLRKPEPAPHRRHSQKTRARLATGRRARRKILEQNCRRMCYPEMGMGRQGANAGRLLRERLSP